jgi:glycyl-tRNA synthetase beta subunit
MAFPLILALLLSAGGGAIGGALARQPEINRLKAQVKKLQEEIERLQSVIKEQDRQIRELKIRYNALKAYSFSERAKQKANLKGAIMFQYCFKEYMDLLVAQTHNSNFVTQKEEQTFFNIFENMINNHESTIEEKMFVREYIRYKYPHQLDNLIECDMGNIIEKVESINVA